MVQFHKDKNDELTTLHSTDWRNGWMVVSYDTRLTMAASVRPWEVSLGTAGFIVICRINHRLVKNLHYAADDRESFSSSWDYEWTFDRSLSTAVGYESDTRPVAWTLIHNLSCTLPSWNSNLMTHGQGSLLPCVFIRLILTVLFSVGR